MKTKLLLAALAALALFGCAQVPLDITKYVPQDAKIKPFESFISTIQLYSLNEDPDYEVDANIYEYNNVLSMIIAIQNKTKEDLAPENYSITLADGRDLKKIKLLSRQELINIRAKYAGDSNGAIQDKVVEATMTNALKVANMPTKEKLADLITIGINNYFSFRTIYANDTRQGVLCFIPDFKLEYPLTLSVKINDRVLPFYFMPEKVTH
ncbi:MAG TPA: hypothetical protein VJB62_03830 [Patescibacteria group bacterium]|nr:hypothetical protein [Patescibacteria group bacterium]